MTVSLDSARHRLESKLLKWGAVNFNPVVETWNAVALVTFTYQGKNYVFRHPNLEVVEGENRKRRKPKSAKIAFSELSWGLCRLIDNDIRGIFPFSKTANRYVQLSGSTFEQQNTMQSEDIADLNKAFGVLDLTVESSNEETRKRFLKLAGMYHPDRALNGSDISEEDKLLHEKKMTELNQAYDLIKKARGIA